jgi:hypothetical protein
LAETLIFNRNRLYSIFNQLERRKQRINNNY